MRSGPLLGPQRQTPCSSSVLTLLTTSCPPGAVILVTTHGDRAGGVERPARVAMRSATEPNARLRRVRRSPLLALTAAPHSGRVPGKSAVAGLAGAVTLCWAGVVDTVFGYRDLAWLRSWRGFDLVWLPEILDMMDGVRSSALLWLGWGWLNLLLLCCISSPCRAKILAHL